MFTYSKVTAKPIGVYIDRGGSTAHKRVGRTDIFAVAIGNMSKPEQRGDYTATL